MFGDDGSSCFYDSFNILVFHFHDHRFCLVKLTQLILQLGIILIITSFQQGLWVLIFFHTKVAYLYRSTIFYIGKNVIVIPFQLGFDSLTLFNLHFLILTTLKLGI